MYAQGLKVGMSVQDVQALSLYEFNAALKAYVEMESKPVMSEEDFEDKVSELQAANISWVKKDGRYRR